MFNKLKILVVGPKESGKSVISNFLADATEAAGGTYHPTQGARILEFEVDDEDAGHSDSAEVELWDCSGDQKFEICWPSMQKDAHGVVFVYNPSITSHENELEKWHLHFAKEERLRDKQCLIMAHQKPTDKGGRGKSQLGGSLGRIRRIETSLDDDPDMTRRDFKQFLNDVAALVTDRREQEELSIIE